ncbi:MAG: hypothetical protein C4527_23960 [Candidatus Omnitrophota bacterium]|jgi:hypothetical protein|nr:MAG: hypothetical protein C4527_23960 [Candidatus Omnitrophota bacterium]
MKTLVCSIGFVLLLNTAIHAEVERLRHHRIEHFLDSWGSGQTSFPTITSDFDQSDSSSNSFPSFDSSDYLISYPHVIYINRQNHPPSILKQDRLVTNSTPLAWGMLPKGEKYTNFISAHGKIWGLVRNEGRWSLCRASLSDPLPVWRHEPVEFLSGLISLSITSNSDPFLIGSSSSQDHFQKITGNFTGGGETIRWNRPEILSSFLAQQEKETINRQFGNPDLIGEFNVKTKAEFLAFASNLANGEKITYRYRISPGPDETYGSWSEIMNTEAIQLAKKGQYFQYQIFFHEKKNAAISHLPNVVLTYRSIEEKEFNGNPKHGNDTGADSFNSLSPSSEVQPQTVQMKTDAMEQPDSANQPPLISQNMTGPTPDEFPDDANETSPENVQEKPDPNTNLTNQSNSPINEDTNSSADKNENKKNNKPENSNPVKNQANQNHSPKNQSQKAASPTEESATDAANPDNTNDPQKEEQQERQDPNQSSPEEESRDESSTTDKESQENNHPENSESDKGSDNPPAEPSSQTDNPLPNKSEQTPNDKNAAKQHPETMNGNQNNSNGQNQEEMHSPSNASDASDSSSDHLPNINPENPSPDRQSSTVPNASNQNGANRNPLPASNQASNSQPNKGENEQGNESADQNTQSAANSTPSNADEPSGKQENPSVESSSNPSDHENENPQDQIFPSSVSTPLNLDEGEWLPIAGSKMLANLAQANSISSVSPSSAAGGYDIDRGNIVSLNQSHDRSYYWLFSLLGFLLLLAKIRKKESEETVEEKILSIHQQHESDALKKSVETPFKNESINGESPWESILRFKSNIVAASVGEGKIFTLNSNNEVLFGIPVFAGNALCKNSIDGLWDGTWKKIGKLKYNFHNFRLAVTSGYLYILGGKRWGGIKVFGRPIHEKNCVEKWEEFDSPKTMDLERAGMLKGRIWALGKAKKRQIAQQTAVSTSGIYSWKPVLPKEFRNKGELITLSTGNDMLYGIKPTEDADHLLIYSEPQSGKKQELRPVAKLPYQPADYYLYTEGRSCFMMEIPYEKSECHFHVYSRDQNGRFLSGQSKTIPLPFRMKFHSGDVENGRLVLVGHEMSETNETSNLVFLSARLIDLMNAKIAA